MTDAGTATDVGAGTGRAASPRERYRAQVCAEIKQHARQQIATAGASALSLNAIAKRMGLSGPALYRYFAGRDALLTELIADAYRSLADAFRTAAASGSATREPGAEGVVALADALRAWALADPQRYFLVYGTPVPGYHAPEETTAIAAEIMEVLLDTFDGVPDGPPPGATGADPDAASDTTLDTASDADLHTHLAAHRQWAGDHPAPPRTLRRALTYWTRLHGVLSLEVAGHFEGMGFDPERLYTAEVKSLLPA
ncbi:TetR/AcrR family transcriptional regulator [Actinacidiphila alni]|uniref:TetR/AcrR family transcriptional regulator n=1 Tax=Actinacidiphila alni TaxID=380248 RepID=UPI0034524FA2